MRVFKELAGNLILSGTSLVPGCIRRAFGAFIIIPVHPEWPFANSADLADIKSFKLRIDRNQVTLLQTAIQGFGLSVDQDEIHSSMRYTQRFDGILHADHPLEGEVKKPLLARRMQKIVQLGIKPDVYGFFTKRLLPLHDEVSFEETNLGYSFLFYLFLAV